MCNEVNVIKSPFPAHFECRQQFLSCHSLHRLCVQRIETADLVNGHRSRGVGGLQLQEGSHLFKIKWLHDRPSGLVMGYARRGRRCSGLGAMIDSDLRAFRFSFGRRGNAGVKSVPFSVNN